MEVGEELARRGHQVTVVSPQRYDTVPPNVTDIVIQSQFEAISNKVTEEILTKDKRAVPPYFEVIENCSKSSVMKYFPGHKGECEK